MKVGRDIIATVTDVESANAALEKLRAIQYALTSQRELLDLWNANVKRRGLFYDKSLQRYTIPPTRPARNRKKSASTKDSDAAPQDNAATQDAPQGNVPPQDAHASQNDANAPQGSGESEGQS